MSIFVAAGTIPATFSICFLGEAEIALNIIKKIRTNAALLEKPEMLIISVESPQMQMIQKESQLSTQNQTVQSKNPACMSKLANTVKR